MTPTPTPTTELDLRYGAMRVRRRMPRFGYWLNGAATDRVFWVRRRSESADLCAKRQKTIPTCSIRHRWHRSSSGATSMAVPDIPTCGNLAEGAVLESELTTSHFVGS